MVVEKVLPIPGNKIEIEKKLKSLQAAAFNDKTQEKTLFTFPYISYY